MAVLNYIGNEKNVFYHKVITEINEEEKKLAKDKFEKYRLAGTVKNSFEDDNWEITNEILVTNLNFAFDEVKAKRCLPGMTAKEFKELLKCYMALCLGNNSLTVLRQNLTHIQNAILQTDFFTKYPKNDQCLRKSGVGEFVELVPFAEEFFVMEVEREDNLKTHRVLAEYDSYYLFDELITEFWKKATKEEKKLYYPVYLWWKIGMIIPVRVTEFIVIPKNCLRNEKGRWFLKIRRTNMKGFKESIQRYRVDTDYKVYEYEITDEIAYEILRYIELSKEYKEQKGDALISCEMYLAIAKGLNNGKQSKREHSYLNLYHMQRMLDLFYINVLEGKYNLKIISKAEMQAVDESGMQKHLEENEIIKISLGDTRHIAIQNLLLNGCNILMAKEITGHDTVNMIYHYSSNMQNLVKARAYSLFKRSKQEEKILDQIRETTLSNAYNVLTPKEKRMSMLVELGECYSPKMVYEHKANDCFNVGGDCRLCRYLKANTDMKDFRKTQELELQEKVSRLKMWLSSEMQNKDTKESQMYAEELKTAATNLEVGYIKDYEREEFDGQNIVEE